MVIPPLLQRATMLFTLVLSSFPLTRRVPEDRTPPSAQDTPHPQHLRGRGGHSPTVDLLALTPRPPPHSGTGTAEPCVCAARTTRPPARGRATNARARATTPDGRPGPWAPVPGQTAAPAPGLVARGARSPRGRTPASPAWSAPCHQQRAEGQSRAEVAKLAAQPGNRPVDTAIFSCSPTQPPARTATSRATSGSVPRPTPRLPCPHGLDPRPSGPRYGGRCRAGALASGSRCSAARA